MMNNSSNLRSGVLFFGGARKCGNARVGGREKGENSRAATLSRSPEKKERLIAGYNNSRAVRAKPLKCVAICRALLLVISAMSQSEKSR